MRLGSIRIAITIACAASALAWSAASGPAIAQPPAPPSNTFLAAPYLQLGNRPRLQQAEGMTVAWLAADVAGRWSVEVKRSESDRWRAAGSVRGRSVRAAGIPPHRVCTAEVDDLAPGQDFRYRVLRNGRTEFEATGKARTAADDHTRFAVFGDCGNGTAWQTAVAWQTWRMRPDAVVLAGDIVYPDGRASEYLQKFFPVYNADQPSPFQGVPLLRSRPFMAAPGNHDTDRPDLAKFPDGLAFFYYWMQPLNGPLGIASEANSTPATGPPPNLSAFLDAAGRNYPRIANFSFDYGNTHWTILDSNPYVDWSDRKLRDWLRADLKAARPAGWQFVAFHHCPFSSGLDHLTDQWMRQLCPLFEEGAVDIVFSGHVHNYQRSYPLRFAPRPGPDGQVRQKSGKVDGDFDIDHAFDGRTFQRPNGVLYLVTGGGGGELNGSQGPPRPQTWQPYTRRYFPYPHSLTVLDVSGASAYVRQVSEHGFVLDRFTLSK